ncbi:MAG: oxygen-independent coproporphyrinogen III oxidase [Candidatus Latescibacteria bacterium]|nr:oxygen-independent coproporphyrinogen III oxidase [Candidatus Latescibacterota bacterium]NIO27179.1 oxygen-independent coproporphyrinogen III oxidase [Candidatus Latescibacterota bacterium]NIO54703.1 oxygen-independent coproporphyrinogen III oxidase [Candidatus Latescibacterota bacterium]NIT00786.1 oxygen-independent coproporphyrinogen III oxidase [Candidatus Latescibacterota bacterium]NIT37709.1 oxygen-independent coproporphyrinogen III oxidase [Candidatus Latescibacterota bacterium]
MGRNKLIVNIDLLKKYSRSGPRYTSYPTAPYFHEGIGPQQYVDHIKDNDRLKSDQDISLYFHLPFCDTLCYFCGCNMLVTHHRERIEEYVEYLIKEIELIRPLISQGRKVAQLHWGGGTPSYLPPDQIRRLGNAVRNRFDFTDGAEVGVEIDPRGLTRDHMAALSEVGFNRCSMGIQDFDPKVQESVNRVQPEDITKQTIDWARELGFQSVNVDLMYGLPFQSVEKFSVTLDKIIRFDPDRLAVFNYAHLPKMIKHQKLIRDETLPSPEVKLQLLKLSIERLTDNGYVYIGMDHFAKPDDELTVAMREGTLYRNFQGYSTNAGLDLFALGMSSISLLPKLYVQNYKKLKEYYQKLDEGQLPIMRGYELSGDDRLRREVIMELMCNFRLVKARIEKKYNIDFDSYFENALESLKPFRNDDLVILENGTILVTDQGRLLIRNIAMNFDAYLEDEASEGPQYSKTV